MRNVLYHIKDMEMDQIVNFDQIERIDCSGSRAIHFVSGSKVHVRDTDTFDVFVCAYVKYYSL